jgi:hypothetical protein
MTEWMVYLDCQGVQYGMFTVHADTAEQANLAARNEFAGLMAHDQQWTTPYMAWWQRGQWIAPVAEFRAMPDPREPEAAS